MEYALSGKKMVGQNIGKMIGFSGEPELLPFEPAVTCETEYPITTYQPKYFVTESFEDAKLKLKDFAKVKTHHINTSYLYVISMIHRHEIFRRSKSQWMSDTTHIISASKFSTLWTLATTLPPISELKLTTFLLHFTVSKYPKPVKTGSTGLMISDPDKTSSNNRCSKINLHWFHLVLVFYPTYAFLIF